MIARPLPRKPQAAIALALLLSAAVLLAFVQVVAAAAERGEAARRVPIDQAADAAARAR